MRGDQIRLPSRSSAPFSSLSLFIWEGEGQMLEQYKIIWHVITKWLLGTAKIKYDDMIPGGTHYKNSWILCTVPPALFVEQRVITAHVSPANPSSIFPPHIFCFNVDCSVEIVSKQSHCNRQLSCFLLWESRTAECGYFQVNHCTECEPCLWCTHLHPQNYSSQVKVCRAIIWAVLRFRMSYIVYSV